MAAPTDTTSASNVETCQREGCDWSHDGTDLESSIDAWEQHILTGCPQTPAEVKPQSNGESNGGPDDPIGTVRAGAGLLAVRAHSANPDYGDDLVWYVIDIGSYEQVLEPDSIEAAIVAWPIVYQP